MEVQYTFKRYEKKYMLTQQQYEYLYTVLKDYMELDQYGRYTICNVYFDTDDFDLIRKSIEKPVYKEKFRMRSYGVAGEQDAVFAEIKKKFKGVVYKRRIDGNWNDIMQFIKKRGDMSVPIAEDMYSVAEMSEFVRRYEIKPKVFIAYDREALIGKEDSTLRLTFDQNIRWRDDSLNLWTGDEGTPVQIGEQFVIMELKVQNAIPLWFAKILSDKMIYPGSFSKYGTWYRNYITKKYLTERNEKNVI